MKNSDVVKRLRGPKGSNVAVYIQRYGQKNLLKFNIERDVIPQYSVDSHYMVDDEIGYIKISRFSATTFKEFKAALKALIQLNMSKLIFELTGYPGGYMYLAISIVEEFLEENKISELLVKYNKFMPIPIKFGTKEETLPLEKNAKEGDKPKTKTVDNIINNTNPAWTKQPKDLKDEDYKGFYRELYPMQFEEPLFNIHLNVDYPFNLTGILYFPKLTNDVNIQKDKIQLYQNQVFVTDNVEGIVPEFLTLLRGVIDSPDIPLNVSRSYLQADGAVKKISAYITRKVADKLASLFKNDRDGFEKKWNDIKIVIEYGMLSEEKFFEKSEKFALYPTVDEKFYTYEELHNKIKAKQTDKDDKLIILYSSDKQAQHSYIENAKNKGYEVLLLDSPIVSHLIQKLESSKEKIQFARVDSDHIENLINKDKNKVSKLLKSQGLNPKEVQQAIEELRKKGVEPTVLSPCPRHEIDHALGEPQSPLPFISLFFGAIGCTIGYSLPAWTASDWVLPVGGKPILSITPFTVIGFEMTILHAAIFTLLGLTILIIIESLKNPIPKAAQEYLRFQRDRFGIVVRCEASQCEIYEELLKKYQAEEVHVEKS